MILLIIILKIMLELFFLIQDVILLQIYLYLNF